MEIPVMLGIFTLAGTVFGAFFSTISKKWRTPADDREDKSLVLTASDALLTRFQALLAESDVQHKADIEAMGKKHGDDIARLAGKVTELERKVENLEHERSDLIAALVRFYHVALRFGGKAAEHEVKSGSVPDGVYLPSYEEIRA